MSRDKYNMRMYVDSLKMVIKEDKNTRVHQTDHGPPDKHKQLDLLTFT